jgi:predicted metalloprotease with PDZ domain
MMRFAPFIFLFFASADFAQNPLKQWTDALETHYDVTQPVINYTITVDTSDLSSFWVEMRLHNMPDTFNVAMAAHPEYDDKYWRFVKDFSAHTKNGDGIILRSDSGVWQIIAKGGAVDLQYRIHLPTPRPGQRAAWRPFLSPTGGLVGGPHSFMYVVGQTLAPSHVQFHIPRGWQIATGLQPTSNPYNFFAPSAFVLIDCPALIGKLAELSFDVQSVPHRVVFWPGPDAKKFDTTTFVFSIQKIVQEAASLFGRLPYREYSFLIQDNAFGALEHSNSVTLGIPSADLAANPSGYLEEIAHEYFHAWNLIRIHPAEFGDVDFHSPPYSNALWWSEGLTMFYADLLLRRAGLPVEDSSRINHLERLIERYYESPGNYVFSAEKVSLSAFAPNGMLGDYEASTHLQGELLGSMMDLLIRNKSDGHLCIDDVMRMTLERFSGIQGLRGSDIEKIVSDFCKCSMDTFFNKYIRGQSPIEFNEYLQLIGLRADTTWKPVTEKNGRPAPDLRVYAWQKSGEPAVRIGILDPSGSWAMGGLHTGDILKEINGKPVHTTSDFWQVVNKIKTGDTVSVIVQLSEKISKNKIRISGYRQPHVVITQLNDASEKERRLYNQWATGK